MQRIAAVLLMFAGVAHGLCGAERAYGQNPMEHLPVPPIPAATARPPYDMFWIVGVKRSLITDGRIDDTERSVDLTGSGITRDKAWMFGESNMGYYPKGGPAEILRDPTSVFQKHRAQLRKDLDLRLVDKDFSGPVIIDYEDWPFVWSGQMTKWRADWENALRTKTPGIFNGLNAAQKERVLQQRWEETVKDYLQVTLDECRLRRPKATFGFYGWPVGIYFDWGFNVIPPRIGYEQNNGLASAENDRIQWLYDMADFIAPAPYVFYRTVGPNETASFDTYTNTSAQQAEFLRTNIAEARRVARGKPVYSVMWLQYQGTFPTAWKYTYLNKEDLRLCLEEPWNAGADGVFVWDWMESAARYNDLRAYTVSTLTPVAHAINQRIAAARNPTNSSGGSSTGSSGTTGGSGSTPPPSNAASSSNGGGSGGGGGGGGGRGGGRSGGGGGGSSGGSGGGAAGASNGKAAQSGAPLKLAISANDATKAPQPLLVVAPSFTRAEIDAAIERLKPDLFTKPLVPANKAPAPANPPAPSKK